MKRIIDKALKIIDYYKTNDPFELCEEMGILVLKMDLPQNTNGIYVNLNGLNTIILNELLESKHAKFVCAHELGHIMLHEGTNYLDVERNTNFVMNKYEKEADIFAVSLLVDEESLSQEFCDEPVTVESLSYKTGIPKQALLLRFNIE